MDLLKEIQEYFYRYNKLDKDGIIYADYLPSEATNYAIIQSPMGRNGVIKQFATGDRIMQFAFAFVIRENYSTVNNQRNFNNSKFFQELIEWIEDNNAKGILPNIEGVQRIEVVQTPFLFDVDPNGKYAQYQMTARVIYEKKKENKYGI